MAYCENSCAWCFSLTLSNSPYQKSPILLSPKCCEPAFGGSVGRLGSIPWCKAAQSWKQRRCSPAPLPTFTGKVIPLLATELPGTVVHLFVTLLEKRNVLSQSYIIFFFYPQMWFCSREIQPLPGLPSNDGLALRRHGQCRCAINSLFFSPPHLVLKMLILAHII